MVSLKFCLSSEELYFAVSFSVLDFLLRIVHSKYHNVTLEIRFPHSPGIAEVFLPVEGCTVHFWVFWAIFAKCILCCVWSLLILFHYFWLVSDLTKISLHVWLQKGVTRCSFPFKSSNRRHLWKPLWPSQGYSQGQCLPCSHRGPPDQPECTPQTYGEQTPTAHPGRSWLLQERGVSSLSPWWGRKGMVAGLYLSFSYPRSAASVFTKHHSGCLSVWSGSRVWNSWFWYFLFCCGRGIDS